MNARRLLTSVHRWTGLALAVFLIVVAGTGAMLPFQDDLQRMIAPERFVASPYPGARPLDWVTLHRIAERRSGGVAPTLVLHREIDEPATFAVQAEAGSPPLGFDEILLDPYTGREIARDTSGALRDGRAQIIPFLYQLHQSLALGDWGVWLLGIVALAWTLDCFVGFYLTLPTAPRRWWSKWGRAWRLKLPASGFRLHFDLHRAIGLWLWPMLFVFAWSGVGFNLPQIYQPVMSVLTGFVDPNVHARAHSAHPPGMDWSQALTVARQRAALVATMRGIRIERERELRFVAQDNSYAYAVRTPLDRTDDGANSWLYLDGDTGQLIGRAFPTGGRAGNTIDYWLGLLHEAAVFGLPYRIFVSAAGISIVVLTITGIVIWLRKRGAKRWHRTTSTHIRERTKIEASSTSAVRKHGV